MSSDREIVQRIMARVGHPVRFKYPGTEGHKHGVLRDRVTVKSDVTSTGVRYWDVIDLVEFPNERKNYWVRFGYYRQEGARLRWAGQTSLAEPEKNMRRLFQAGWAQAVWFRRLITGLDEPSNSSSTPMTSGRARDRRSPDV